MKFEEKFFFSSKTKQLFFPYFICVRRKYEHTFILGIQKMFQLKFQGKSIFYFDIGHESCFQNHQFDGNVLKNAFLSKCH